MAILNNDCLKQMKKMKAGMFDVVVTSPPYNLNNSTGSGMKLSSRGSSKWSATNTVRGGYNEHEDNLPHDEYVAWQKDCLAEMLRLIKPCLLYTSPSPRDRTRSRMPSSA